MVHPVQMPPPIKKGDAVGTSGYSDVMDLVGCWA